MILSCPACSAQFVVDPRAIGVAGRVVRCAKCKHEWKATAPLITADASDIQPLPKGVKPMKAGAGLPMPMSAISKSRSKILAVAAAVFLMMPLLTIKIMPYLTHDAPHKVEEKATPIALDGMPTTRLRQEEGRSVLDVEGVLINHSGTQQKVPVLKASGLNARGKVVREWTIPLTAQQLEPGQRLPFNFSTPLSDQGVEDVAFHLL